MIKAKCMKNGVDVCIDGTAEETLQETVHMIVTVAEAIGDGSEKDIEDKFMALVATATKVMEDRGYEINRTFFSKMMLIDEIINVDDLSEEELAEKVSAVMEEDRKMENKEIFLRKLIANYMSYRAAILQNDGYMINLYYGYTNSMKQVLIERFKMSSEDIVDLIGVIEEAIKNGQSLED